MPDDRTAAPERGLQPLDVRPLDVGPLDVGPFAVRPAVLREIDPPAGPDDDELPGAGYHRDTETEDFGPLFDEDLAGGRHRALHAHRWAGMPPKWIVPAAALIAVVAFIAVAMWAFRDGSGPNGGRNAANLPGVLPFDPPGTPGPQDPPPPNATTGTATPTPTGTGGPTPTTRPTLLPSPIPLIPPPGGSTPSAVPTIVVTTGPTPTGSPSPEPPPAGFTAAARTDNWGTGYNTYVTVRNVGSTPALWQVRVVLDSGESLQTVWNATAGPPDGPVYTFGSNSGQLAAGQSFTFGFQVGGTATDGPVSCAVVGGSGCAPA